VDEDASITITAAQFVICDTDDDLTKMTVNLGSGSNYNVSSGNTIIPVADFNGTLNVPVTVHDGSNSSASFEASVTVIPVNDRPVIKPIPDQEIKKDSAFSDIYLDEYITDNETSCELITWTYAGNNELTVKITDRVASITVADADWTGSDTVVFCATDNDMVDPLSAKDTVVFKVLDITGTGPVTLESLDILIYPNPAKEQVNVIFKQAGINEAYIKIEIISIQGEVVYILKHSTKDKVVVLDVYDLKPGVYFMRFIASGDPVKTEKLVIHP
jgi:hypothetical protein